MKKMSKTILFFGNERLATGVHSGVPTLRALLDQGYEVPAVVTAQNQMAKSRHERQLEVSEVAREHNIPLLSPADLAEARDQLAGFKADAAVLIAYGKIVPAEIISLFPHGIINVHPSLLSRHRGPTPIETAILDGDRETGVSLMRLETEMDTGPVYGQRTVPLQGKETKQELADRLSGLGTDLVIEYLPKVLDGSARPLPQVKLAASYTHLITKSSGQIDWSKPAVQLEREIRAYAGWPKSHAKLGSNEVIITQAAVAETVLKPGQAMTENKRLLVGSGKGSLEILRLKPAGKPEMSAEAFLAGYKL